MEETEALFPIQIVKAAKSYAGIGSRNTPEPVLQLMEKLGRLLAEAGLTLRSGGSDGADRAFEAGCDSAKGSKEIFLPWKRFNDHPSIFHPPSRRAFLIAARIHPNWSACSSGAQKLLARNCHQILGPDLCAPVDFVLYWTREVNGEPQGGTETAVRLATAKKIRCINLWNHAEFELWNEFATGRLLRHEKLLRNVVN